MQLAAAQLEELNRQLADREQQGAASAPFFETLLSDRLVFRRASGAVVGKADFLEGLRGPSPFSARKAEEVDVRVLDEDHALVTLVIAAQQSDGGAWKRFRNIRLFEKSEDGWRLELWFNYAL